jgi:penicillin amidase
MKFLKRLLLAISALLLPVIISFFVYRQYALPHYEGTLTIHVISDSTEVFFDSYGVPHIYAANEEDALAALGYVHAQDRLWQMELLRRIAAGRLAEVFGNKALQSDMFFAGTGIDEASQQAVKLLDPQSREFKLATAYLNGVNDFLLNGATPIEFTLLGITKKKFDLRDIYNIYGYMSFSFAMAHKTDPLLTSIRDDLGTDYLKDLGLGVNFNTTQIKTSDASADDYLAISSVITDILDRSPVPSFIGSNSWVIAPGKTANGKVIFANDPHIGFSQPGTWYEAHLNTPGYEIYGFYLAGTPFPLLAHNRHYAYGLTMFENDDIDFFREQTNPADTTQYKTTEGWKSYDIRNHQIPVKDSAAVNLQIRVSGHGPVMNGLIKGLDSKSPVAMSWVYTQNPLKLLEAVYGLSHARDITGFRQSVSLIAAPGLNVMYGDATGNVAWFASGKLYKVEEGVNTNFILEGSNGIDDKRTFLPFEKNPSAVNPDWNYVYSANNQHQPVENYVYPGYYLPRDRALRITNLLDSKNNWNKNDVLEMINDNTSPVAPTIARQISATLKSAALTDTEKNALAILSDWNGSHHLNSIAPTIYNRLLYRVLENSLKDELGEERFSLLLGTHLIKQMPEHFIANDESPWWDNVSTDAVRESRTDVIRLSFRQAVESLVAQLGADTRKWTWGKVHTVEYKHPLGTVAALRPFFNVGPFEINGSTEVINNLFFPFNDKGVYEVTGGPSTRRIIDFSDIENGLTVLPTGQSGNLFSKHYSDQAKLYAEGKFRKMMLNKHEIVSRSTRLLLVPSNKIENRVGTK